MRALIGFACFIAILGIGAGRTGAAEVNPAEPNAAIASGWWSELTNAVTPVGWRDHPHRFSVVYNGTIIGLVEPQKLLRHDWKNPLEGLQLDFTPSADGAVPPEPTEQDWLSLPDGRRYGDQGWEDRPAPALWTRWGVKEGPMAGLTLRQTVFAHMAGGGAVKTVAEPMYCWVRLEVAERATSATTEECGFLIKISAPHMGFDMSESSSCRVRPEAAAYAKSLELEPAMTTKGTSAFVTEEGGRVRLAVTGETKTIKFVPPSPERRSRYLFLSLPARQGAHVDLLLPMVPGDREAVQAELELGYKKALAQADLFWSDGKAPVARARTPEPLINNAIENTIRMGRMISTTVPSTGQKTLLSGSMFYSYLWVTPTSMALHMLLDPWGRHADVDRYIEIYRQEQGRVQAPGPDFKPHPGYFGAPAALDSGNQWLTDHGSVLYTASRHALLTDDKDFIARWTEPILKACDFIIAARRLPRAAPAAQGVMPPASASDISAPIQAFWCDAWSYKGLVTAARLMRVIGHPRAAELEREAADYREAIGRALHAKSKLMPTWPDASGRARPYAPMTLTLDASDGRAPGHAFYLDTGPLFGVFAGVLPPEDEIMTAARDFFREGPHANEKNLADTYCNRPPVLIHEMSSCEPCYSWNVFHSHQSGDRQRFLEGMYSLFTGGMSRQTGVSCETRGGITENTFTGSTAVYLARLAVVDDEVEPDVIHLLRLAPRAWVAAGEATEFENMPTEFGPVSLRWRLADEGRTLKVDYEPRLRRAPRAVVLHVPPIEGIERLKIGRRTIDVKPGAAVPIE